MFGEETSWLPTSWLGIFSAFFILVVFPFVSALGAMVLLKIKSQLNQNGSATPQTKDKTIGDVVAEIHSAVVPKECDQHGD